MIEDYQDIQPDFGENEDLEQAIDQDNGFQDEQLKTKVIFAVQEIGKVETFKKDGRQFEAYIKKEHCVESIRDLVKYIRKDVPDNPKVCLILSELNIIESDLIKILVLHAEDKILSFWLLALMSYMTSKPSQSIPQPQKSKLCTALQQYKKTFTKNEGFTYLILHISDYAKTAAEKRKKAHYQMMEFIVILLRNLLQVRIGNQGMGGDQLHCHFLIAMMKEDMLGPLFYVLQNQRGREVKGTGEIVKGELMVRIQTALLEIFYHFFTCLDPASLYETKKPLNLRLEALKLANKKPEQVRHSRFMPNFEERNMSGIHRIVHTLDKKEQVAVGQRKAPVRVSILKKVKKIERQHLEESYLQILVDRQDDGKKATVRQLAFEYAKQFVEVGFEILSKLVFDNIYKQNAKVTKQNIIQYLLLCSWQLKMTRYKHIKALSECKHQKDKGAVEFDLGQILFIMQTGHFELIYKLLYREATREKKKDFDINMFNAALILFLNYLEVIEDISKCFNASDRKNANALMANMFRHDIARILKIGFHQVIHEKVLKTLVLTTYKFFMLLSDYSGGKVLTIQTNKMLKPKKKSSRRHQEQQQAEKQLQDFISEDSDNDNNSDSYNEGEQKRQKKKKNMQEKQKQKLRNEEEEMRFQERKFNLMTEFSIVADYEIISKYLVFLKDEQFLENGKMLNEAIFFYLERIANLLKGQWLFYQAQTLITFNQVLNNPQFMAQHPKAREILRKICSGFINLLKKNRLALVQSLFRYTNIPTKDQILKNYEQIGQHHAADLEQDFF